MNPPRVLIIFLTLTAIFFISHQAVSAEEWGESEFLVEGGGPSLIQDQEGRYWLAYSLMVDNNEDIYLISSNDLKAWSAPIKITRDNETDFHPSLIQSGNGKFYVVFTSLRNANYDLYFSESPDGIKWSEPLQLTEDENSDWYPYLMEDSRGELIISFSSRRGGSNGVFVMTSSDGVQWSEERRVTGQESDIYPMIVERQGRYWLLFVRHTGDYSNRSRANEHELFLTYSDDLRVWSGIAQLTQAKPGSFNLYPSFIKDGDENLWISYTSDEPGNEEVFIFGSSDGELWSWPEKITKNIEYLDSINSTRRFKCDLKSMIQDRSQGFLIAYECSKTGSDIYLVAGNPELDFSKTRKISFNVSVGATIKPSNTLDSDPKTNLDVTDKKPGYLKILLATFLLIFIAVLIIRRRAEEG
jgi:beta-xylosidase